MATMLTTKLQGNAQIQVHNRNTDKRSTQVSGLIDAITIYQNNIYFIPICEETASSVEASKIMVNPEYCIYFQILNVTKGIATILPLVDGIILTNGTVIGALS